MLAAANAKRKGILKMRAVAVARAEASEERKARAVSTLQRAWRQRFRFGTLKRMMRRMFGEECGLSREMVCHMDFDALVPHLRERNVLRVVRRCMFMINLRIFFIRKKRGIPRSPEDASRIWNVRQILAANMAAFFSHRVFETMGECENRLLLSSVAMLDALYTLHANLDQRTPEMFLTFDMLLARYFDDFETWEKPDNAKLCERISDELIRNYYARMHSGDADECERLRLETIKLEKKLLQLGKAEGVHKHAARFAARIHKTKSAKIVALSMESVEHELLLDPSFQLDYDGASPSMLNSTAEARRERRLMDDAMWGQIKADIARRDFRRVARSIHKLRDGLQQVAGEQTIIVFGVSGHENVTERGYVLSLFQEIHAHIQRFAEADRQEVFEKHWKKLMDDMLVMRHDDWTCMGLRVLLACVGIMVTDVINMSFVEVPERAAVHKERDNFQTKLTKRQLGMERTLAWRATERQGDWLPAAIAALIATKEASKRDKAFIPETLLLDAERLKYMHAEFCALVDCCIALHALEPPHVQKIGALGRGHALPADILEAAPKLVDNLDRTKPLHCLLSMRLQILVRDRLRAGTVGTLFPAPTHPKHGTDAETTAKVAEREEKFMQEVERFVHVHKLVHGPRYVGL